MINKIKKLNEIDEEVEDPVLAVAGNKSQQNTASSVLFEGYRSLGYYASDLPFSIVKSDQDYLLATAIGEHSFYVYDTKHLNLAYMSRYIPETILGIEATSDGFVYTALQDPVTEKCVIVCWKKMHRVAVFEVPNNRLIIKFMAVGDFLFTLCSEGNFIVFDRRQTGCPSGSVKPIKKQIPFVDPFDDFIHPRTYVNKLLFSGCKVGDETKPTLQLWNIMSQEMVFSFDELIAKVVKGKKNCLITCMEESPVVDVIAIGFENGLIAIVNLLYSEVLLTLDQS